MKKKKEPYDWQKRALEIEEENFENALKFEKKLKKLYKESLEDVQGEIDKLFRKYADKNGLTYAEAQKLITETDIKSLRSVLNDATKDIKEYIQDYNELDKISRKVRITRLEELEARIKAKIDKQYATQSSLFTEELGQVYKDGYTATATMIKDGVGLTATLVQLDDDMIKHVLRRKNAGMTFSKRIWEDHRKKVFAEVQTQIARGLATGKGNKEIMQDVENKFGAGYSNAERLVRTEYNFYMNQAVLDNYKELGIEEYKFDAVIDSRTSDICRGLHGKPIPVSEAVTGINYPPLHPRCRSTVTPVIKFD